MAGERTTDDVNERIKQLQAESDERQKEIDKLRPDELAVTTWAEMGEPPPREFVIDPWIPVGCVSSLYGIGGFGKSRLALQMAAGITSGGDEQVRGVWINGPTAPKMGSAVPRGGAPVLFASWEDEQAEQARRLAYTHDARHAPWVTPELTRDLKLAYLAGDGPAWGVDQGRHISVVGRLQAAGKRIMDKAEKIKAVLVILDPLAAAFAGNENDRSAVRAFLAEWNQWAAAHKAAVLVIAHESKSANVSGSTDWVAGPRSVLVFNQARRCAHRGAQKHDYGNEDCQLAIKLSHVKANYSRRFDALELKDVERPARRWEVVGKWQRDDGDTDDGDNGHRPL